jgi:hypothetical protein
MRVHLCERVRVRAFVIMLSVCIWCVRTCVCGLWVRAGVRAGIQRTCAHSLPPPPARPPPTAPHTHGRTHINTHAHAHTSVCTQAHASMHAQKRAQIADSQRCVRAAMHADPPLHPLSPPEPRTTEDQKQPIRTGRCASAGTRAHLCHCARINPPERLVITCRLCPFLTARPPIPPIRVAVPTAGCTRTHKGTHPRARARI